MCVSKCKPTPEHALVKTYTTMNKTITAQVTPLPVSAQPDDSPVKTIMEAVKEKLAEITPLKYIDQDWGQLDDYSPNFPVKWPCALLDISQATYSNLGQDPDRLPRNRQQARAQLTVSVANLKLTNTSRHAPAQQKHDASVVLDIIQQVHAMLHGYAPSEAASQMIRQSMQRIRRDDGVQQYELTYLFEMFNV